MTNEDTVTRLSQGEINNIQKITPKPGGGSDVKLETDI